MSTLKLELEAEIERSEWTSTYSYVTFKINGLRMFSQGLSHPADWSDAQVLEEALDIAKDAAALAVQGPDY